MKLEERQQALEERLLKVEEALAELICEVRELRKAVGSLGRRFGGGSRLWLGLHTRI